MSAGPELSYPQARTEVSAYTDLPASAITPSIDRLWDSRQAVTRAYRLAGWRRRRDPVGRTVKIVIPGRSPRLQPCAEGETRGVEGL